MVAFAVFALGEVCAFVAGYIGIKTRNSRYAPYPMVGLILVAALFVTISSVTDFLNPWMLKVGIDVAMLLGAFAFGAFTYAFRTRNK